MGEMVLQKIQARVERWERWYYRRGKGREMGEMVLQKIQARVERWERWYYRRYRQG